ncbi:PD-(D/E)XK nuclease family protein [Blautia sp. CLA-JM-H16]|uniref:PD-(D/E)XK nuclease family protein n=1 Tax=Blautia aquisgranensis TaxID=3133153 RepID=A0ABV1BE63_9FIRM
MSLQFIIGGSGSGKSCYAYQNIIEQAGQHPEKFYYVIVPEQFTMQTQKTLVEMSPGKGILNIDILSFERLAYRVLEEVGGDSRTLLEETGKSMVLQKMVQQHGKELSYLGGQMRKTGYLDEVKSILSEFMQYDIQDSDVEEMIRDSADRTLLQMKLKDVSVLYQAFKGYLKDHYMTGEEVMDALEKALPFSGKLKNSVLLLDGYTGFTPIQMRVVGELLTVCEKVMVTVTMDAAESLTTRGKPYQLFYMSRQMLHGLSGLTRDIEEPVLLKDVRKSRFAKAPALHFLEKNIFRYRKNVYRRKQDEICMFSAVNPLSEMEETARRIARLVREKGCRYGEIAVITGNLEEYGNLARQVFEESDIPYFIDEKHTVLMNPFVEYFRAALEMAVQDFTYESVFRYLRCGMSCVTREEADLLENYVLALGIRGFKHWDEKWVRIYRGMPPESIQTLNEIRERFADETRELALSFKGGKKTVREYCTILYEFAVKSQVQQKLKDQEKKFRELGDKAMEKEYAQIYGIVMELLDSMVEILGDEVVNRQDFRQLLETGLTQAKVALIPPSMDQVLVGDMERTRLKDIRALFFVGVNEGNIPKNTSGGGILTELDREFFEEKGVQLAPGPKELMNMQRFYLYLNMTKPRELLCLSFCQSDSQGKALSPAFLVNNIQDMFPEMEIRQCGDLNNPMELLELPGISMDYFLRELSGEAYQQNPVFQELYSWYLESPVYRTVVEKLVRAAFSERPSDQIGKAVAGILYGEISPYSATRLERYAACAFAHFLQYGLKVTERAEYEFRAMDMGNVMHMALEKFAVELRKEGLDWAELTEEERNQLIDSCLDQVSADYGNTILKSSARNEYMIERTRRILHRTVWALQEQLKHGDFRPEGFEVIFGGGRIDRVDIMEEPEKNRVYVKVIDYKTGNTSFDLLALYHGLQLQLMIYLDGALQVEQRKYPDKEIVPAGVFYYNVKDPMIQEKIHADVESVSSQMLKKLKMNGLVQADDDVSFRIDNTLSSIPVSVNKDGSFSRRSSVASRKQFDALGAYVRQKICDIRESILDGNAAVEPYELGKKNACTYCAYSTVCGFDRKIPGYEFHRLPSFSESDLWKKIVKEDE